MMEKGAYRDLARPWDWNDIVALGQQPRERNLAGCSIDLASNPLQFFHELENIRKIVLRVSERDMSMKGATR